MIWRGVVPPKLPTDPSLVGDPSLADAAGGISPTAIGVASVSIVALCIFLGWYAHPRLYRMRYCERADPGLSPHSLVRARGRTVARYRRRLRRRLAVLEEGRGRAEMDIQLLTHRLQKAGACGESSRACRASSSAPPPSLPPGPPSTCSSGPSSCSEPLRELGAGHAMSEDGASHDGSISLHSLPSTLPVLEEDATCRRWLEDMGGGGLPAAHGPAHAEATTRPCSGKRTTSLSSGVVEQAPTPPPSTIEAQTPPMVESAPCDAHMRGLDSGPLVAINELDRAVTDLAPEDWDMLCGDDLDSSNGAFAMLLGPAAPTRAATQAAPLGSSGGFYSGSSSRNSGTTSDTLWAGTATPTSAGAASPLMSTAMPAAAAVAPQTSCAPAAALVARHPKRAAAVRGSYRAKTVDESLWDGAETAGWKRHATRQGAWLSPEGTYYDTGAQAKLKCAPEQSAIDRALWSGAEASGWKLHTTRHGAWTSPDGRYFASATSAKKSRACVHAIAVPPAPMPREEGTTASPLAREGAQ